MQVAKIDWLHSAMFMYTLLENTNTSAEAKTLVTESV
jgi:hypothetical protein